MEWVNFQKVLIEFGNFVVERAKLELGTQRKEGRRTVRRVASGNLQSGLFSTFKQRKGNLILELNSNQSYADFIHEGVNGTKINRGSKYSFKKGMINTEGIRQWVRVKGVRPRKDGKFIPQTENNVNQMVFAIGRSIARNGIPSVPFFSLAIESAYEKYQDKFDTAIIKDIDIQL